MYRKFDVSVYRNVRSNIEHYYTSDLVDGGSGVHRPGGVRDKRHDGLLGEVDGGMKSAGRVNQTRQHLQKIKNSSGGKRGRGVGD